MMMRFLQMSLFGLVLLAPSISCVQAKEEESKKVEAQRAEPKKAAQPDVQVVVGEASAGQSGVKQRDEGHSLIKLFLDLVLAMGTLGIAIFTLLLYRATKGLLIEARNQFPHFKKNVEAATKAAEAASGNVEVMKASERAYVFAEVTLTLLNNTATGGSEAFGQTAGNISFWNYGKTPAVITKIRGYIDCAENIPQELINAPGSELELPPGLGIGSDCSYSVPVGHKFAIDDFSELLNLHKRLYFVGKIEYLTVHNDQCTTGFCWHVNFKATGSNVTITRDSALNVRT